MTTNSNDAIQYLVRTCSLGALLVASTDRGVCAILLGDQAQALIEDLQLRFPNANLNAVHSTKAMKAELEKIALRAAECVDTPNTSFEFPLDMQGTPFQQQVWKTLQQIPMGQTRSYSDIAQQIGRPQSARAIAGACAANPIAVIVPCHRVVRHDGALSGYRWGIERKRNLLEREAALARV